MFRILVVLSIPVLLLVVIAGSASLNVPADTYQAAQVIVLEDLRFTPNRIDARVGIPITVTLRNAGTQPHDLNFPSIHMPGLAGVESILQPGESRTVTLEFDEPGTHVFACTLPGHAAAGMTGAAYVKS